MEIVQLQKKQNLSKWIILVSILLLGSSLFVPLLSPLILAAIFALALNNYVEKIRQKSHFLKKSAAHIVFLGFTLFLVTPLMIFPFKIYTYFKEAINKDGFEQTFLKLNQTKDLGFQQVASFLGKFNIEISAEMRGFVDRIVHQASALIIDFFAKSISKIPQVGFLLFIFLLSLFYFLTHSEQIKKLFMGTKIFRAQDSQKFIQILASASYSSVLITLLVGFIQALFVATGAALFKAGDFIIVLIVTSFFSLIPIIGAAPVAFALSIIQFIGGDQTAGIGMVFIALFAGVIDNILRPYFMSQADAEAYIHPILALIGILGAIELLGFPGLFIGPMILNMAVKFLNEQSFNDTIPINIEENPHSHGKIVGTFDAGRVKARSL